MHQKEVHQAVKKRYGAFATAQDPQQVGNILDLEGRTSALAAGYSPEELAEVPEESEMGLSCGNPLSTLNLQAGEVVLDLGSGGGKDCFIAARYVGNQGCVIGIDLTPEMIELARKNASVCGLDNVEFRLGEIENLPVASRSVDVVISNCVMNLLADKALGFTEAYRVLKPGGRISISDIVTIGKTPKRLGHSMQAYTACLAGAVPKEEYISLFQEAGFREIQIVKEKTWPFFSGYASLHITARKGMEENDG